VYFSGMHGEITPRRISRSLTHVEVSDFQHVLLFAGVMDLADTSFETDAPEFLRFYGKIPWAAP
jgi:hypothetical protein